MTELQEVEAVDGPQEESVEDERRPEAGAGARAESGPAPGDEAADGVAQTSPAEPEASEDSADPEDSEDSAEAVGEGGPELGPGEELSDDELAREAAALLFASPEPLGPGRLRGLLGKPHPKRLKAVLASVAEQLEASPLPVRLCRIAGGWRVMTDPAAGDVVQRLRKEHKPERISGAALETLAIVAYRQPVTKAEVEAIRGVQSGAILRALVDRGLARVTGRASVPGAPLQYGTTKEFLERFGLATLKELPRDGELTQS